MAEKLSRVDNNRQKKNNTRKGQSDKTSQTGQANWRAMLFVFLAGDKKSNKLKKNTRIIAPQLNMVLTRQYPLARNAFSTVESQFCQGKRFSRPRNFAVTRYVRHVSLATATEKFHERVHSIGRYTYMFKRSLLSRWFNPMRYIVATKNARIFDVPWGISDENITTRRFVCV